VRAQVAAHTAFGQLLVKHGFFHNSLFPEKVIQFGAESNIIDEWMSLVVEEGMLIEPREQIQACRDPADDKFLEAAIAGQPDFFVSGDRDLTDMGEFRSSEIVTPRQFYERFSTTS
jgi:predicted nucleic acid-binding protein